MLDAESLSEIIMLAHLIRKIYLKSKIKRPQPQKMRNCYQTNKNQNDPNSNKVSFYSDTLNWSGKVFRLYRLRRL